ncbi:MAG: hypothetical protein OGM09_13070 [Fusobacterium varium]|uniref:hypothetical protein n=1 Tax=Fusobacterium varium TaxID=856 RepID=UPI002432DA8A|nr:hypothetical protein [Fusobacterium varium]UYI78075.1 MAG: hypothetical protein OGM09_13070 [Fusobacterium varium]
MKNEAFGNSLYSYLSRAHHKSRIFMDEELRKKGITDLGIFSYKDNYSVICL